MADARPDNVRLLGLLLVGALTSSVLGWSARRAEDLGLLRGARDEAAEVAHVLRREVDARTRAVERMAARWEAEGTTPAEAWRADAENYLADYPGLWAIAIVGPDGRLTARAPRDAQVEGRDLTLDAARRRALEVTRATDRSLLVGPVELYDGGPGLLLFVPLGEGALHGWLVGVFQLRDFVASTHPPLEGHHLRVFGPGGPVYTSAEATSAICASQPVTGVGEGVWIEVCATPELVRARHTQLPLATVLIGLAMTALSAALLRALGAARARTAEARQLAESLRSHAQQLEAAQRDIADLSYSVSHELRAPLRGIDGHAAILEENAPPEARPGLARIRANAQRMGLQLDGIIALFRVIRKELAVRDTDVSALARARIAERRAAEPGRTVDARVSEGIVVRGDPQLVQIVVAELVDNAWKFSRDGVDIEVGATETGFYVRDRGAGFDMAFADKLFRAFERLHAPGEYEGLGIGLAIAARAVERHGGRIRGEARPGEGAVFWVEWG